MSMIVDLGKPVESSEDTALLASILSALVGQPCLKAVFSYGGELMVHFGEPIPYTYPKMAEEKKGSWILGVRASGWRIVLHDPPRLIAGDWPELQSISYMIAKGEAEKVAQKDNQEEIEKLLRSLAGDLVVKVSPLRSESGGVCLSIDFRSGSNLIVCPKKDSDEDAEPLADWELFTPYHRYLRCGPGWRWSYLESDKVAS